MSFQAIKPHCVAFLQHVRLDDSSNLKALPVLLLSLSSAIKALRNAPDRPNPQFAAYIFFPFSQFLQHNAVATLRTTPAHQAVFKNVLDCLRVLVDTCELDQAVREQLVTFTALTLGGPLGNKNVESAWSEDVKQSVLALLKSLLDASQDVIDQVDIKIPLPIIAHILNTILVLAESADRRTQLAALGAIASLVKAYLWPEDLTPRFLPGTVSTLCKVVTTSKANSVLTTQVLDILSMAIRAAINDDRCRLNSLYPRSNGLNKAQPTSLEEIFAISADIASNADDLLEETVLHNTQFQEPGTTAAWLQATSGQLHRAILSILPFIRNHESPVVRSAMARFCFSLLSTCYHSLLPPTTSLLLEELLVLSQDDWSDVADSAMRFLRDLQHAKQDIGELQAVIAEESLTTLPHTIFMHGLANERNLQRQLQLIVACFSAGNNSTSAALDRVERWSRTLMKACELVLTSASSRGVAKVDETTPWLQQSRAGLLLEAPRNASAGAQDSLPTFPELRFKHIPPGQSVRLLSKALKEIGAALLRNSTSAGSTVLFEHFITLAMAAQPRSAERASCLWIAEHLLEGYTSAKEALSVHKRQRLARDIVDAALSVLIEEDEEALSEAVTGGTGHVNELLDGKVDDEEMRGVDIVVGLNRPEDLLVSASPGATAVPSQKHMVQDHRVHSQALALQLLAQISSMAGTDFRPHFLYVLYPLLRSMAPIHGSSGLLQAYAYCSIHHIAHNTAYAGPADMIIQNVDYILNAVSANFRGSSDLLDPLAPSVLLCVLDLAGEGVLPYLGDAVEEIFDALDKWHAYDLLVSELLRVLGRLVGVVEPEQPLPLSTRANRAPHLALPDKEQDLRDFETWFKDRHEDRKRYQPISEVSHDATMPLFNPHKPFTEFDPRSDDAEEEADHEDNEADEVRQDGDPPPLSASQALVLSILRKCLYFLSHSSPFLRARVMALIVSCIPVLHVRESDLLPEIHRFWPYLLARLDDDIDRTPPYVLAECLNLVNVLMEYKGDFMHQRILNDVWPCLRKMLAAKISLSGTAAGTDRQKLAEHVIDTTRKAITFVDNIKNEDLWQIAVIFRDGLASRNQGVRDRVKDLFTELGKVEPDLVWLVLQSSIHPLEGCECLLSDKLSSRGDVPTLLSSL